MDELQEMKAVETFILTLDQKLPKKLNMLNAVHDTFLYDWSVETLCLILKRIEKMYAVKDVKHVK